MNRTSAALYFCRTTIDTEDHYSPGFRAVAVRAISQASRDPTLRDMLDQYRDAMGLTLDEAVADKASFSDRPRRMVTQGVLYALIGKYWEKNQDASPEVIGFYSRGVFPAFLVAGLVSVRMYLVELAPYIAAIVQAIRQATVGRILLQTQVHTKEGHKAEAVVGEAIRRTGGEGNVFLKDIRSFRSVLLVGTAGHMAAVLNVLTETGALEGPAAPSKSVNAAHLPLVDKSQLNLILGDIRFAAPTVDLVDSRGQTLRRGENDQQRIRDFLVAASTAPLHTQASLSALCKRVREIHVIGSIKSSKVLATTPISSVLLPILDNPGPSESGRACNLEFRRERGFS